MAAYVPVTSYVLNVQPPVARESPQRALGPVTVREFRCPDYLCDGRIVYRPTPEEVGFYEYHRWAVSPREMITRLVAADLRSRALFQERRDSRSQYGRSLRVERQH